MPKRSYSQMMLRTPPNTPNTRQRTGVLTRSMARDIAINAASNFIPGAGTARNVYNAARVIQGAWRAYKSRQQSKTAQKANSPARRTYFGTGKYVGRFRSPKKGGKTSIAKKLGAVLSVEQYGKINDPDLVVMGHTTHPMYSLCLAIAYAILRKTFKKAFNFDGNDINQEIPAYNYNDSSSIRLVFVWKDEATGTITAPTLNVLNDKSIKDLATTAMTGDSTDSLVEQIFGKIDNETTWHTRCLERVLVRKMLGSETGTVTDINMLNEVLKISVSSSVKIQNRTLAADAGAGVADTDRVDSQPLKGRVLKFKGLPKLKNQHVAASLFSQRLAQTEGEGSMLLVRGAELPGGHLEPKTKQDWTNCYAQANVSLQPGEIKSNKIFSKRAAYFNNFFKSYQQVSGNTQTKITSIPGFCSMFFFEEVMNTGSSNKISLSYEQQLYISAYLVTGRTNSINTHHTQQEFSNWVA